jgi:hypothetical protein
MRFDRKYGKALPKNSFIYGRNEDSGFYFVMRFKKFLKNKTIINPDNFKEETGPSFFSFMIMIRKPKYCKGFNLYYIKTWLNKQTFEGRL